MLATVVGLVAVPASADPYIYETDFEDFTLGTVDGQNGWVKTVNDGFTDIVDSTTGYVIAGSQSLNAYEKDGGGQTALCHYSHTGDDAVMYRFRAHPGGNAYSTGLYLVQDESGTYGAKVGFRYDQIRAWDETVGDYVNLMAVGDNDTPLIKIVAYTSTDKYDVYVDGFLKATDFGFDNALTTMNRLELFRNTATKLGMDNLAIGHLLYETHFNDYNLGNVNGQDGWVVTNGAATIVATSMDGQSLEVAKIGDTSGYCHRDFDANVAIEVEFTANPVDASATGLFMLEDSAGTFGAKIKIQSDWISAWDENKVGGADYVALQAVADADTPIIRIVANAGTDTYDIYIDDVLMADDFGFDNALDTVSRFEIFRPSTTKLVVDNLTVVPEPATMVLLGLGGVGLLIRRRRR
jgi:hypothetical protein